MSNCGIEGLLLFDELFGFVPQESSSFSSERFSIVIGLRSDIERPESFFGVSEKKIKNLKQNSKISKSGSGHLKSRLVVMR